MENKFLDRISKLILPVTIIYIIGYYYVCYSHLINFPTGDDIYQTTVGFMKFYRADDIETKIKLLFDPNGSHFLFFHHLMVCLDYFITGQVNHIHLIFFGNLILLAIWYLLYIEFRSTKGLDLLLFLPVTLLAFTPGRNLTDWLAAALQHTSMLFFGLLSVYALSRYKKGGVGLAIFSMFMCMSTMVSGVLLPIVGWLIFVFTDRGNPKKIINWTLISFLFYFILISNFQIGFMLNDTKTNYLNGVLLFFSFLGGGFVPPELAIKTSLVVGGISLFFLFYLFFKTSFFQDNPTLFGFALFCLGIAALVGIGRNNYPYTFYAGRGRFYWMQMVYVATVYSITIKFFYEKKYLTFILFMLLVLPSTIYRYDKNLTLMDKHNKAMLNEIYLWAKPPKVGEPGHAHKFYSNAGINYGVKEGYFIPPNDELVAKAIKYIEEKKAKENNE